MCREPFAVTQGDKCRENNNEQWAKMGESAEKARFLVQTKAVPCTGIEK